MCTFSVLIQTHYKFVQTFLKSPDEMKILDFVLCLFCVSLSLYIYTRSDLFVIL